MFSFVSKACLVVLLLLFGVSCLNAEPGQYYSARLSISVGSRTKATIGIVRSGPTACCWIWLDNKTWDCDHKMYVDTGKEHQFYCFRIPHSTVDDLRAVLNEWEIYRLQGQVSGPRDCLNGSHYIPVLSLKVRGKFEAAHLYHGRENYVNDWGIAPAHFLRLLERDDVKQFMRGYIYSTLNSAARELFNDDVDLFFYPSASPE